MKNEYKKNYVYFRDVPEEVRLEIWREYRKQTLYSNFDTFLRAVYEMTLVRKSE